MILPPLSLKIHIVKNRKRKIRLWFPLFCVWLVLFALMLLFSPLVLLVALILWPWKLGKKLLMFGPMLFYLFGSLHGLAVQVESIDSMFLISIT